VRSRGAVPISGVGGPAFGLPDGNGSLKLFIWKDGVIVSIGAIYTTSPLETEKAVAATILKRI